MREHPPHLSRGNRILSERYIMYKTHKIALNPNNGKHYDNPRLLKRYERKLKCAQRRLSSRVFKSNNWLEQKRIVECIHYRIACIRRDAHHVATLEEAGNCHSENKISDIRTKNPTPLGMGVCQKNHKLYQFYLILSH